MMANHDHLVKLMESINRADHTILKPYALLKLETNFTHCASCLIRSVVGLYPIQECEDSAPILCLSLSPSYMYSIMSCSMCCEFRSSFCTTSFGEILMSPSTLLR